MLLVSSHTATRKDPAVSFSLDGILVAADHREHCPHLSLQVVLDRSGYEVPIRKAKSPPGIVEDLFCVVVDRNPAFGDFFMGR